MEIMIIVLMFVAIAADICLKQITKEVGLGSWIIVILMGIVAIPLYWVAGIFGKSSK